MTFHNVRYQKYVCPYVVDGKDLELYFVEYAIEWYDGLLHIAQWSMDASGGLGSSNSLPKNWEPT